MKSKKFCYKKIIIFFSIVVVLVLMTGCGEPIVSIFSADPSTINEGESSTLTWDVSGATTVTIEPEVGTVDSSGSTTVSPVVTTDYTLIATNSAGSVTATVTVIVINTITIFVTIYHQSVLSGRQILDAIHISSIGGEPFCLCRIANITKCIRRIEKEKHHGTLLTAVIQTNDKLRSLHNRYETEERRK